MNSLRVIVHASFIFEKDYFTIYIRDWNSNSGTDFSITCGKCSRKLLSDILVEVRILEISKEFLNNFNFGVKLLVNIS